MKFETYLEAIRLGVINELLNINVQNKPMIEIENNVTHFSHMLFFMINYAKKYNLSSDKLLTTYNKDSFFKAFKDEDIIKYIKDNIKIFKDIIKDNSLEISNDLIENFIKIITELRNESSYIRSKQDYYFFVKKQLYGLEIKNDNTSVKELIFFTYNESSKNFDSNSIMRKGGSDLFNGIASIVKKEVPRWESEIFTFSPQLEFKEKNNADNIRSAQLELRLLFGAYFRNVSEVEQIDVDEFRKYLDQLSDQTKKKLKESLYELLIVEKLPKDLKSSGDYFLNFLFSNEKVKSLKRPKKYSSEEAESIKNFYTLKEKLLELVYKNSMRTRLYRMVIKQMFGSKIFIKEKENRLFFSLKEIK
jgi:hypothetical protein